VPAVELESDEMLPDMQMESDEFEAIAHEEIERLPAVYGSTFALFAIQEMSYDEIVQVKGVPLGTVKAQLFRARTMLRTAVAKRMEQNLVSKD
jgi:RNA polymerase sigma-70 factor (ECF subfamily)